MRAERIERLAQGFIVLAGLRYAIVARNLPSTSDGLAYLDLARAYLRHDWTTAVNGYWGPLYAGLLAVTMRIVHPTAPHEFATARGLNFVIFVFCLYCFTRFWHSVADYSRKEKATGIPLADASPIAWILVGYLLFLTKTAWYIEGIGPDILVGGMVLLISARVLELQGSEQPGIADYAALGALLAVGYYTKAILFYFGIFILLSLAVSACRSHRYRGVGCAALVCAILISPYTVALSHVLGHFSVGESGRLNYAWLVDGTEPGAWAEGTASFPFFPGPVISNSPRAFQVPRIDGITYAPWYDASRFDGRSRAALNIGGEARQISGGFKSLFEKVIVGNSALLVCTIILISGDARAFFRRFASAWFCTAPIILIIGMYLLVHVVERFMIGFWLVMWGIVLSSIVISEDQQRLARRILLCGVAVFAAQALPGLLHEMVSPTANPIERDLLIADAMGKYGIRQGDSVGVIGDGQLAF